jgi:hypothetical protein
VDAYEAGLVGGVCELVMDAQDGLPLGDDQAREVFGEVAALTLVGEEVAVLGQSLLDEPGELDDAWHDRMPRSPTAPEQIEGKAGRITLF